MFFYLHISTIGNVYPLQAAKERKYDDWYGMYTILEDNYFKELTTNGPPVLNAGS